MSEDLKRGDLLIATVALSDPNFDHTVVLLCEHQDEGSYGLVLNRGIKAPREVLDKVPQVAGRLFHGGPVQPEVMQVLHPYGDLVYGSVEILSGLWMGGDFDVMGRGFDEGTLAPDKCRFFLGYAGWGKGQLAGEMDADAWISVRGSADLVLESSPEPLWARAIRQCAREQPIYMHFPEDANLN